jgi:Winged helix-turn helix
MPRPSKPLADHVRDGTFRARRHHTLLAGTVLPWAELAPFQAQYVTATSEPERRAIAVAFERAVRGLRTAKVELDGEIVAELDRILALPPVPMQLAPDDRACQRYWRGMEALAAWDAGRSVVEIAATLNVSRSTVRRNLRWLVAENPAALSLRASSRPLPAQRARETQRGPR